MKISLCSACRQRTHIGLCLGVEIGDRQFGARGAEMPGAAIGKAVLIGNADNKALFAAQRCHDILLNRNRPLPRAFPSWTLMRSHAILRRRLRLSAAPRPAWRSAWCRRVGRTSRAGRRLLNRHGQHLRQPGQAVALGRGRGIARTGDRAHLLQQLVARVRLRHKGRKRLYRALGLKLEYEELVPHHTLNSASDSRMSCWRATFNASAQRWSSI